MKTPKVIMKCKSCGNRCETFRADIDKDGWVYVYTCLTCFQVERRIVGYTEYTPSSNVNIFETKSTDIIKGIK